MLAESAVIRRDREERALGINGPVSFFPYLFISLFIEGGEVLFLPICGEEE